MPNEKQYVPKSGAKLKTFPSGNEIIRLSLKRESLEFLERNLNDKGYVNIGISQRREVSQYGDTHTVWLDTWEPGQTRLPDAPGPALAPKPKPVQGDKDDVPF